jgi:hypothetical protein
MDRPARAEEDGMSVSRVHLRAIRSFRVIGEIISASQSALLCGHPFASKRSQPRFWDARALAGIVRNTLYEILDPSLRVFLTFSHDDLLTPPIGIESLVVQGILFMSTSEQIIIDIAVVPAQSTIQKIVRY